MDVFLAPSSSFLVIHLDFDLPEHLRFVLSLAFEELRSPDHSTYSKGKEMKVWDIPQPATISNKTIEIY